MAFTPANTEILTVELLEKELGLSTLSIVERLEERFEIFFTQKFNKKNGEDIALMSQDSTNFQMQTYEEEKITSVKELKEMGLDVSQNANGIFTGLREVNQKTLGRIFVSEDSQLKKVESTGLFNITGKIRNGTLQFIYNNGLSILTQKICLLKGFIQRRAQVCKITKLQLKIPKKKNARDTRTKKTRKKTRRKWRWKNYNLLFWAG